MARTKKDSIHYVDNKKLYTEMVKFINGYREAIEKGEQTPRIPAYIGACIMKISNKLANRPNFIGYSYREEMISDGVENCIQYLHNFDPEKSTNPFSYFTTIIWFAFLRRINKEQKQQYIKQKITVNSYMMNTLVEQGNDSKHFNSAAVEMFNNDMSPELVAKFEPPKKEKKPKAKKGVENFVGEDNEQD